MMMDIDRLTHQTVSKDNKSKEVIAYLKVQGGRASANEHIVPEMMFDNPDTPEKDVQGVSAIKVLNIAHQQGQRIYVINQANRAKILPKLTAHSHQTLTTIRNGLNAGKQITISERPITANGWSGSGFIVLDTKDGTGAYLLEGGANGGFINTVINIILSIMHSIGVVSQGLNDILDSMSEIIITVVSILYFIYLFLKKIYKGAVLD